MSLTLSSSAFSDALIVIGAAGLVIPAFAALRISPVAGFILVGIVCGPFGLGALPGPEWLRSFAIAKPESLEPLAEIGIAMLLFSLGLELSREQLRSFGRRMLTLGPVQLIATAVAVFAVLFPLTGKPGESLLLAFALTLSSTAVATQSLEQSGRTRTRTGRTAIAILLFQDIALAPILLGLAVAASGGGWLLAAGKALGAVVVIVVAGRLLARPLFRQAARTRRAELFLATSLVAVIAAGALTAAAGLSPVVGALIAGALIAETEYRRQVMAAIAPFQGLLLGVFLITVGLKLDLGALVADPWPALGLLALVLAVKTGVVTLLLRLTGQHWPSAVHVGTLLASPSETSLIVLGTASAAGLIGGPFAAVALLAVGLSLALSPLLGLIGARLEHHNAPAVHEAVSAEGRTLIIGYGRVGRTVAGMLERHGLKWLAIDNDPDAVNRYRKLALPVVYGDARRLELIETLGLDRAAAIVLTLDEGETLDALARAIRHHHPGLTIVARARDAAHAARLYRLGVTDAVPETVEASLQLAEAALVDLGVPMGPVIASIHERRAELRQEVVDGIQTRRPALGRRLRDAGRT